MKIKLNISEKKFLKENNIDIEENKEYSDDEYIDFLELLYFKEVSYVDIDEKKS